MKFLYSIYKWLFVVPMFGINTVVFTTLIALFCFIGLGKWARVFPVCWAKVMQWITPMPVKVIGRENLRKGQSYVITANHQSAYDIFAIYGSLPVDFRWILKYELRKVPVLGYACYKLGHIFINRTSARKAYNSLQEAKKILSEGASVVIFPEGHRSGRREMGPIKHGAFKMATDLDLPILPVTIKDTYKVMQSGLSSLTYGSVEMVIHPEINPDDYVDNRDGLIEAVRVAIQY